MRIRPSIVAAAAVPLLALTIAAPASASSGELELAASLHHSAQHARATGNSAYERRSGHREAEVTVRVPGLAGRWVKVYLNHRRIGALRLSANGYGHREWSTEHGQYVPKVSAGDPVRVRTYRTGTLVASGWYHHETDD